MSAPLPPGQVPVDGFPRFGTHLAHPPPRVPADPAIEIGGPAVEPFSVQLADLASLPRRERTSDLHCVAGWTATDLRWEGVAFATFYGQVIEPVLQPGSEVTHIVFGGLDGYRSVVTIEDALGDDVLLAEHLDGRPLDGDHGAPIRVVSPQQYGFVSTKHLCRIEVHTAAPSEHYDHLPLPSRMMLRYALAPHPRARVWEEERHRVLPSWAVRLVYRSLIRPFRLLSARGSERRR